MSSNRVHFTINGFRVPLPSSWGRWIQLFVNLVFVGMAGVALYLAHAFYLAGDEQSAWAFGGVGLLFLVTTFGKALFRSRRRSGEAAPEVEAEGGPWQVRKEWRTNRVAASDSESMALWIVGLTGWNLVGWTVAVLITWSEWEAGAPTPWAVWSFPALGLVGILWTVHMILQRRKFGETVFAMETMPGVLGGTQQGLLETGVRAGEGPEEGFHVQLSCYRRYVTYSRDSDGNRRKEVRQDLKWRDEKRIKGRPYGASADRLAVPVFFQVPADQPPSTAAKKEERIMWMLEVEADVPGIDFAASVEIPVFETEDSPAGNEMATPASKSLQREDGAVYWELDEDQPAETENPYAEYEIGRDLPRPVTPGVTMEDAGDRTSFHFGKARNKGMAAFVTVVALAVLAGDVLMLRAGGFPFLIHLFMFLFIGGFGYIAFRQWTYASTVTVDNGEVTVVRGPFGRGEPTTIPCWDLAEVSVQIGNTAGGKAYYDLFLVRRADDAAKEEKVEQLTSFLNELGVDTRPGTAERPSFTEHIAGASADHANRVRAAGSLSDKQDADWIAEKIMSAAARQASWNIGW